MSIVEALKKLIKTRGGNPVGSDIAEVINNFANDPAPTPSGGGVMNVTIEALETSPFNQFDKTAGEIFNAYKSGMRVLIDATNFSVLEEGEKYAEVIYCSLRSNGSGDFIFHANQDNHQFIFNSLDDHPHPYVD